MYSCKNGMKYVDPNSDFRKLKIVSVLLGGSVSYKHRELRTASAAKDWDGIIIVKRRIDVANLVNEYRRELCQLLDIECEEYPDLQVPRSDTNDVYKSIDAVRFVGKTANGTKKGAKILSVEHLISISKENHPSNINLLSFKDIRVLNLQNRDEFQFRLVHQASHLDEKLVILHDMDVFVTDSCTEHGARGAVFGVTADLLMSGSWIFEDRCRWGYRISRDLLYKFRKLHTAFLPDAPLTFVFKNQNEFQSWFNRHLENRMREYDADMNGKLKAVKSNSECKKCVWKHHNFIWGRRPEMFFIKKSIVQSRIVTRPAIAFCRKLDLRTVEQSSPFSSNSQSGQCKISDRENKKSFWKQTKFVCEELEGSVLVSQFYPRTQTPVMIDKCKQIIVYPFFDGILLSDIRLEYIKQTSAGSLQPNSAPERLILTIELQRCEDFLRAYCSSSKMVDETYNRTPAIGRFFYNRLVDDMRLKEFYGGGIAINETTHLTLLDLKSKKLIINGQNYDSLNQILLKATELLDPMGNLDNRLVVCGMGDSHSGNLLVSKEKQPNSSHNFLYVDYEIAGYHSPFLDLAKPFFNDVFFDLFYADLFTPEDDLFTKGTVKVDLIEESSTLSVDLRLKTSSLSDAIYQIKTRYLLKPFFEFVDHNEDLELDRNWPSVFGHALFSCAILTRNFSSRPDIFFATLALGVILSNIKAPTVDGIFKEISDIFEIV